MEVSGFSAQQEGSKGVARLGAGRARVYGIESCRAALGEIQAGVAGREIVVVLGGEVKSERVQLAARSLGKVRADRSCFPGSRLRRSGAEPGISIAQADAWKHAASHIQ